MQEYHTYKIIMGATPNFANLAAHTLPLTSTPLCCYHTVPLVLVQFTC